MEKSEFRVLIKHCFLMRKNTVQAKEWLETCYPESTPYRQMVEKWFANFKRIRTNTDDVERSGLPNSSVVPEKMKMNMKNNASTIQSAVWSCFSAIKRIFSCDT